MRRKNHTHQQDIDDLKKQNALLEQQGTWTNGFVCVFVRQYSTGSNVSFCLWLLQFGLWRRRRGTLSSRRTTPLTAACTQTGKAARCRPSTAAPTPALNQSRTSLPTERSCAWSPARPGSFPGSPNRLFLPTSPNSSHLSTLSCLQTAVQETRWRLCESGAVMYKTLLPSFPSWQASCHSVSWPSNNF